MALRESGENYLETIYMLSKKGKPVRSIDIVNELNLSKPTVSVAMKNFREDGYILTDDDGYITLTEKGLEVALSMYDRHMTIARLFLGIGVSEDTAYRDACRVEHYISEETFSCIKKHYDVSLKDNE